MNLRPSRRRRLAPLAAATALVLCLYPLWAKKQAEDRAIADRPVPQPLPHEPEAPQLPAADPSDGTALADVAPETDDVVDELTPEQQLQIAAGADYIDSIRRIPGAAPLVDEIIDYLKEDGEPDDFSLSDLPVDDSGMISLDGVASEKMIKNPAIRAKWDQLMALIASHPPSARN